MFTSGLLCLYKPKNWSSSDCVVKIRNILQAAMRKESGKKKEKIKVGHGGTLDPMVSKRIIDLRFVVFHDCNNMTTTD
jgi:tRNA U55 pseudouridine synthase TruB